MGSFMRYADMKLWSPLGNDKNWSAAHWGGITSPVCPSGVRTAIMDYIVNHGFALDPKLSGQSAFISYCIQMGLYFITGHYDKFIYTPIGYVSGASTYVPYSGITCDGKEVIYDESIDGIPEERNGKIYANETSPIVADFIPRNTYASNVYFALAADLISRRDYSTLGNETEEKKLRNRRIDEANLIYSDVLGQSSVLKFASPVSAIPIEQSKATLKKRFFESLIKGTVFRYGNAGEPGTDANGSLVVEGLTQFSSNTEIYFPNVKFVLPKPIQSLAYCQATLNRDFIKFGNA
jgi:hypothetical protein